MPVIVEIVSAEGSKKMRIAAPTGSRSMGEPELDSKDAAVSLM